LRQLAQESRGTAKIAVLKTVALLKGTYGLAIVSPRNPGLVIGARLGSPLVLGIGFAAFRDVGSFFRNAAQDEVGTPNPIANGVSWAITRGVSQSGNFLRALIHLDFNQDEAGRQVYDGAWPIIAGRRIALNIRFAMPDGVLKLYEPGSEGPQWWTPWADPIRGLPAAGILDRCTASHTCPKIIEHFGSAEVWGLKLTPEWVGTTGDADIPLPDNVRRYYIPSTQHGGGKGGFSTTRLATARARSPTIRCPILKPRMPSGRISAIGS